MKTKHKIQVLKIAVQVAHDMNAGGDQETLVANAYKSLCAMIEPPLPGCVDDSVELPTFHTGQQVRYKAGGSSWAFDEIWKIKNDGVALTQVGGMLLFRNYGKLWEVMP